MGTRRMTRTAVVRSLAEAGEVSPRQARAMLERFSGIAVSEVGKNGVFVWPGTGKLDHIGRKASIVTVEVLKGVVHLTVGGAVSTNSDSAENGVRAIARAQKQHANAAATVRPLRLNSPRIEEPQAAIDLIQRALDVIGSPTRLSEWMQTPLPALNGRTPYSLLDSEDGRKLVEMVLGRIGHGIY